MIYVILGMHKSGTTLVAQMLHQSGINMVNTDEKDSAGRNLYELMSESQAEVADAERDKLTVLLFERLSSNLLNKEIFYQTYPPARARKYHSLNAVFEGAPQASPELKAKMRQEIDTCGLQYPNWGFKDPLTCLTYPIWNEVLPEHRLIVVYRHYDQVLEHYNAVGWRQLNIPQVWKTLRAWATYNQGVLQAMRTTRYPYLAINYANLMTESAEFQRLQNFLTVPLTDTRRPKQYRSRAGGMQFKYLLSRLLMRLIHPHPEVIYMQLEAAARSGG